MEQSESINELASALAKAQAEIKGASKSQENPFFKSNYANLSDAWEACREPLSKNGLSVTQVPFKYDGAWVLVTSLLHSSGQWQRGEYPITATKQDAQGFAAGVTYARRNSFMAMVGVCPEDDDGNKASEKHSQNAHKIDSKAPQKAPEPKINPPISIDDSDFNNEPPFEFGEELAQKPPTHCGKPMMISKFNEREWYCFQCKAKEQRK